jgi:polar amino acid transport system substrate-binding protein
VCQNENCCALTNPLDLPLPFPTKLPVSHFNVAPMKKILCIALALASVVFMSSCGKKETATSALTFAISAEYPPFEFYDDGELKGFDIELAKLIARELGKEAKFRDMQFSTILAAVRSGAADAAISTITITEAREENFDFSESYLKESLSMVYPKKAPLEKKSQIHKKKIACQLGSAMEVWLKSSGLGAEIVLMDHNNQAIEALKAGHVDGVLVDTMQAHAFADKNSGLAHSFIAESDNGYGIAVQKGSALKDEINRALKTLEQNGKLHELQEEWLRAELDD